MDSGRIFLIGMMGSGKTTIGQLLAQELSHPFVDLDAAIEARTKMKVSEMFARYNEFEFRTTEAQILRDLPRRYHTAVIGTGGGTPLHFENLDFMHDNGLVIFLDASAEELFRRLGTNKGDRPILQRDDWQSHLSELMEKRRKTYEQAHISYQVDGQSPEQITAQLLEKIRA